MGAFIFGFFLIFVAAGITGIVFGMQVLRDHSKNRTTAWSKGAGITWIIIGAVITVAVAGIILWAVISEADMEEEWNDYTDTGVMIEWNKDFESFTYQDEEYVQLELMENELVWYESADYYSFDAELEEKPVFNIKSSDVDDFLFGPGYVETMYGVESAAGATLYVADGSEAYCRKADVKKLKKYYRNDLLKHYEMALYSEEDDDKIYDIKLSEKDIKTLNQMTKQDKISYVYNDKMPKGWISSISSDGVFDVSMDIILIDGKWYWEAFDPDFKKQILGKDAYFAYELPENIEKQLPHEFE